MNLPARTVHPTSRARPATVRIGLLVAALGLLGAWGAGAAERVQVFAEFSSGAGEAGVREARLWIDGEEVTEASTVSAVRISYALPGDFPSGTHEARVEVVDALGRSHQKSWSFEAGGPGSELTAFFSDQLVVELDPLPRRTSSDRVRLSGTSLPGVEVEIRVDALPVARTTTRLSGRFAAELELAPGDHELAVAALRPWTGEEGEEVRLRLERIRFEEEAADAPRPEPAGGPEAGPAVAEGPQERVLPGGRLESFAGVLVITKPGNGELLRQATITVLGLAPPGCRVELLLDGAPAGSDVANPGGHFTIPRVALPPGLHELVAVGRHPRSGLELRSEAVSIRRSAPKRQLSLASAGRPVLVRDGSYRLTGTAWPGAFLDVEVDGRLVATEVAGRDGRFQLVLPVERGLHRVVVEALDEDSGELLRSPALRLRGTAPARRLGDPIAGPPLLERPGSLGRGSLGHVRPLP